MKVGLMDAQYIEEDDVPKLFSTEKCGRHISLTFGKARPIKMEMPLKLDIRLARVCGMMPDGSLSKYLSNVSFCQGKDRKKVVEFGEILKERFDVNPIYYPKERYDVVSVNNKSLCAFLHFCLDIHKSDQSARIPNWIKNSSLDILKEYLRYAFAMEGSVSDPRKGGKEIKFHSCDKSFVIEIKDVLLTRFGIVSRIQEYSIKCYGEKYYLYISGKDNIIKFAEIGFALESHEKRLKEVVISYKPKAWEVTLIVLSVFRREFTLKEVNLLFPYLLKSSMYMRLADLTGMGLLEKRDCMYTITDSGSRMLETLDRFPVRVRTNSKCNEKAVIGYLEYNRAHINKISRDLGIHAKTVRDVLRRLERIQKVRLVGIDKFQRKTYESVSEGP